MAAVRASTVFSGVASPEVSLVASTLPLMLPTLISTVASPMMPLMMASLVVSTVVSTTTSTPLLVIAVCLLMMSLDPLILASLRKASLVPQMVLVVVSKGLHHIVCGAQVCIGEDIAGILGESSLSLQVLWRCLLILLLLMLRISMTHIVIDLRRVVLRVQRVSPIIVPLVASVSVLMVRPIRALELLIATLVTCHSLWRPLEIITSWLLVNSMVISIASIVFTTGILSATESIDWVLGAIDSQHSLGNFDCLFAPKHPTIDMEDFKVLHLSLGESDTWQ
jgi:hypothetical protein